jgi:tRNA A-37 threonylcarbamoyl transferase component Bud32
VPQCPTCGKTLEPTVRFCPDDGTPVTDTAAARSAHTPTGQRTQSRELDLPLVLGSRYRLVEARGGGGMAKVYRAVDLTLEREVAVKLINPELRQEPEFDSRFQREARIASQLADPHIVVVHDFGLDATHGPYLVMEFLQGQSLREHLQTKGPLPVRAVLQLSGQLLLALVHAHDKGIVHRDIKPDNIFLLNQSGIRLHVRVLDFGIARIFRRDEQGHAETLTRPGAVMGTPRYMSPEQLAGQPVDARSDLYSAGLVIFEALTGTLPYVSSKKLSELCPEAPAAFVEVLNQCLMQNPADRPPSAIEVYLRLQEPARASGVLLLPPGAMDKLVAASRAEQPTVPYVRPADRVSWWRWRWILLAILLVALLGAVAAWGIYTWHKRHAVPAVVDKETLLGLEIGNSRDQVVARLGKAPDHEWHGNPWTGKARTRLGHVLKPEDLGEDTDLSGLEVLAWNSPSRVVILDNNQVRAIRVEAPDHAVSGRGLKVGAGESQLVHLYSSEIANESPLPPPPPDAPPSRGGKIYRYETLGIGFEVRNEQVTAITLYPPNPCPP